MRNRKVLAVSILASVVKDLHDLSSAPRGFPSPANLSACELVQEGHRPVPEARVAGH